MQPGLLDSQLQTLEKPALDEVDVMTLSIDQPVEQIVQQALLALKVSPINALP
jgi:gluconate kinase